MAIIKSHGVQINPKKILIWNHKPSHGNSLTCLRKHKSRTATERFFTMDNIWSCNNNNDYQVSQCPNQYWSQEDLDME